MCVGNYVHSTATDAEATSLCEHQLLQGKRRCMCAGLSGPPVLVQRSASRFIPQTVQGTYV